MSREFDVILVGASGFTGGLCADYLAAHAPAGLRWAIAGRNAERLAQVRDRLAAGRPETARPEDTRPDPDTGESGDGVGLVTIDLADPASVAAVAARTRVLITTVGPYLEHGEPLVRACAEAGTDYVDLTGEPEFVDRMFLAYDAPARESGARIVHACGFDSVPHDLGAYFTVRELARGGALGPVSMRGVVRASGAVSGGTLASALGQFSRAREVRSAAVRRRTSERAAATGERRA
ncbi:MAG: saccharopine dehydrogenase NADP-binding domain-containing protein, partial [Nocardioides sp.]|uniref:saccharopine dehydrogenase family protein n=1 Tax=Nocardioides sp. TaxID=35761 RepID=UPI0039E59F3A